MSNYTEWRAAPGFPDYLVNEAGQVQRIATGRILKPYVEPRGYHRYNLRRDGQSIIAKGHQLVARAFLGEPTGPLVRHLDGNPGNNHVSNLAYGDYVDNMLDAISHGTWKFYGQAILANKCKNGHPYTPENTQPRGERWRTCRTCQSENIARRTVRNRARRESAA